jgi:hypothetical protein
MRSSADVLAHQSWLLPGSWLGVGTRRGSGDGLNHKRAGASERALRSAGGIDLEGENPMGGTGMKQGRQVVGGARPREREKR